ncbi:MAG: hypothetical protein FD174_2161 [Geobacteraceae bacterium]|nr:MAG: hypothetical protein FD174_2161 [Geobacteraceae bacterium]
MFRSSIIAIVLFITSISWATEWNSCHKDLSSIRENSDEAIKSTVKLRDLYDRYETKKFEYEMCKSLGGDCQYLQLAVNALLIDYGTEKTRFSNIMHSINMQLSSIKETCGYDFKP